MLSIGQGTNDMNIWEFVTLGGSTTDNTNE